MKRVDKACDKARDKKGEKGSDKGGDKESAAGGVSVNHATLIFLHIPKAAGSTLQAVIRDNYPAESIFEVKSPLMESFARFRALSAEAKRDLKAVMGHGVMGLDRELEQPCRYVTMLRDPVDRVVSNYYFVRESPSHRLHRHVVEGGLSLRDYVEQGVNLQMDNGQVRALSATGVGLGSAVPYGECMPEMLRAAMENLERRFEVAGLTERFDESLLLMARVLGWRTPIYRRQKVTRRRVAVAALSPADRLAIERVNRLDRELYARARERFERQLRERLPLRKLRLAWFRARNRSRGR